MKPVRVDFDIFLGTPMFMNLAGRYESLYTNFAEKRSFFFNILATISA
jgi:hypothetical protein